MNECIKLSIFSSDPFEAPIISLLKHSVSSLRRVDVLSPGSFSICFFISSVSVTATDSSSSIPPLILKDISIFAPAALLLSSIVFVDAP